MAVTPALTIAGLLITAAGLSGCGGSGSTSEPVTSPVPSAGSVGIPKSTPTARAIPEPVNPAVRFQGAYAYTEVATKSNTRSYTKVGARSLDTWLVDTSCAKTCVSRVTGSDGSIRELAYAKKQWTWTGTYTSDCVNADTSEKTGKKVTSEVALTLTATKTKSGLIDRLDGTVTDNQVDRCTGGESTLVKVKYRVKVARQR